MGLNHLQSLICTYIAYDLRPLMCKTIEGYLVSQGVHVRRWRLRSTALLSFGRGMKDSVSHEGANRLREKQDSFSRKVLNLCKIVRDQGNTNLLCE